MENFDLKCSKSNSFNYTQNNLSLDKEPRIISRRGDFGYSFSNEIFLENYSFKKGNIYDKKDPGSSKNLLNARGIFYKENNNKSDINLIYKGRGINF